VRFIIAATSYLYYHDEAGGVIEVETLEKRARVVGEERRVESWGHLCQVGRRKNRQSQKSGCAVFNQRNAVIHVKSGAKPRRVMGPGGQRWGSKEGRGVEEVVPKHLDSQ